jgi:signal transduction histidine kinase
MWLFVLVVASGLTLGGVLPAHAGWAPLVSVVLAYAAGRKLGSLTLAVAAFASVSAVGLVLALTRYPDPLLTWGGAALVEFLAAVLPWWAGRYQRLAAEQREREHRIVAEQARLRERARIAQDMHDSLGHELALIALHGGALELGAGLTGEQRRTAGSLREHAVRATDRLHDLVRVMGSSDAAAGLQPPGESMDDLLHRAKEAGLPVRLERSGPPPDWPPLTSQAAHRVVQESLTNAARHAPGATVTVTITHRDSETLLRIVNSSAAAANGSAGTGQGLIGLDERVRLAGGRLAAGPLPAGGWEVSAVLPAGPSPALESTEDQPMIAVSRRMTRRHLARTAALPIGVALALLSALTVAHGVTVTRTGLADDRYHALALGEPEQRVRTELPSRTADTPVRLIAETPPPPGSACEYYHAGSSLTDIAPQVYRLCFAGGVLVAKNRFERV